ncbi:MAG: hypothetical protein DHS20C08_04580 [Rhodomicrobium sp.]|nr:MAG: hypothetical protein DHS20C08_04580 [Rhodomicrobium sp.]
MCFGGGGGGKAPEQTTEAPVQQQPAEKTTMRESTRARYTPKPKTATMLTGGTQEGGF